MTSKSSLGVQAKPVKATLHRKRNSINRRKKKKKKGNLLQVQLH